MLLDSYLNEIHNHESVAPPPWEAKVSSEIQLLGSDGKNDVRGPQGFLRTDSSRFTTVKMREFTTDMLLLLVTKICTRLN